MSASGAKMSRLAAWADDSDDVEVIREEDIKLPVITEEE